MKMKKLMAMLLCAVMLLSLAACSPPGGGEDSSSSSESGADAGDEGGEKVFRFATATEPTSIDIHLGNGAWMTNVISATSEGLVRIYGGELIPGIAESWTHEGTTVTFNLRESVWSDGTALVAQDFIDSWVLLSETDTPMTQFLEYMIDEEGNVTAEATDDYTIVVTLNREVPFIMEYFASPVMIPVRQDLFGDDQAAYYQGLPGAVNGPYNLVEWVSNDIMVLEPNESYWNAEAVKLDRVEIYTVTDDQTQMNMFTAGEIDMVDVPTSLMTEYEDKGMMYYEDGAIQSLHFAGHGSSPETVPYITNRDFIEALSYTIDREAFVNAVYAGAYSPASTYVPPFSTGYANGSKGDSDHDFDSPFIDTADLEKAEESLQKALDTIGATKETMPTFYIHVSDAEDRLLAAQYIQSVAAEIGIKIEIASVPSSTFWSFAADKSPYDFMLGGFGPDVADATTFLASYTSGGGWSLPYLSWQDEQYDALYDASWEVTGEERAEALVTLESYLLNEGPSVPIYWSRGAWMINDAFTNVHKNSTGTENDYIFADKA